MKRPPYLLLSLTVLLVGLAEPAAPAAAASAPAGQKPTLTTGTHLELTRKDSASISRVLVNQGWTTEEAQRISEDPQLAQFVPVSTSFEEFSGKGNGSTGGVAPTAIGECSGSGGWVERIQYINNQFGNHIAYVKLRTNFNYNGSRVTCVGSSRSWYIYGWVAPGVVQWKGFSDFTEYFYTSGGRANGGAFTSTEGRFSLCLGKCGESNWPYAETRAYYNGTSLTNGSNRVTFP